MNQEEIIEITVRKPTRKLPDTYNNVKKFVSDWYANPENAKVGPVDFTTIYTAWMEWKKQRQESLIALLRTELKMNEE
jgi:hypothetical protein